MTQPIKTYRQLTEVEIQLMNELKVLEEVTLRKLQKIMLAAHDEMQKPQNSNCTAEPFRALAIAKTEIQSGFMWANRAIARPQRISLPEDDTDGGE